jgi:hypothetical protein
MGHAAFQTDVSQTLTANTLVLHAGIDVGRCYTSCDFNCLTFVVPAVL